MMITNNRSLKEEADGWRCGDDQQCVLILFVPTCTQFGKTKCTQQNDSSLLYFTLA